MKRTIIYTFLAAVVLFSCRKSDNAKLPDLIRVPTPLITKDPTGDLTISSQEPSKFSGKFIVDLYFKSDVKPLKFDAVVIKNGNKAVVKTIQADITSFPTTIAITGAQLATLFGAPIVLGDKFDIGVDITTQNNQKYLAFPTIGSSNAASVGNQVGASTQVSFEAVCPFNINDFLGAATIQDPDFWGSNYPVTVTLQGTDTYKVSGWVEEPSYYILIKVNAAALTVAVASRVYGPTLPTTTYTNPATDGTGTINACNKKIVMSLNNSVTQGSFGASTITLVK